MAKCIEKRKAITRAQSALSRANLAVQAIFPLFEFRGFENEDLLGISYTSGDEICLTYGKKEIYIEDALRIMEVRCYLTPDDFI